MWGSPKCRKSTLTISNFGTADLWQRLAYIIQTITTKKLFTMLKALLIITKFRPQKVTPSVAIIILAKHIVIGIFPDIVKTTPMKYVLIGYYILYILLYIIII